MSDIDWWRATHAAVWNVVACVGLWVAWMALFGDTHPDVLAWCEVLFIAGLTRWQWVWHRRLDAWEQECAKLGTRRSARWYPPEGEQ